MGIGAVGSETGIYEYGNVCKVNKTNNATVGSFTDSLNKIINNSTSKKCSRDTYIANTDYGNIGVYTRNDLTQNINLPIETDRYKIADASYLEGVPTYEIVDRVSGQTLYLREDKFTIQKDTNTGLEFIMNTDLEQPIPPNILMTDELRNLISDLSEKKGFDVQETSLQGGLTVNRDPKTGLNYLTIRGDEARGFSLVVTSEKDLEVFNKVVNEFQQHSVSSQRETAGLYALLEISGNLKREKEGFTYLTPSGITYIPYDGDSRNAWEMDMPKSSYSLARAYMAAGNDCADVDSWMKELRGLKVYYADN